jgi:membrane protein YqaA with SNARE-associated domain
LTNALGFDVIAVAAASARRVAAVYARWGQLSPGRISGGCFASKIAKARLPPARDDRCARLFSFQPFPTLPVSAQRCYQHSRRTQVRFRAIYRDFRAQSSPKWRRAMLKRAYDWCIAAADKPHALWLMGLVSFVESSFFPVPPDVMLIPMSLARPTNAWVYATVCTLTSVAGGVLGYGIGALLYDSIGHWLISLYGLGDKVEVLREGYARWGSLIILLKGMTPIPYKLVTITSGFAGYNLGLFVVFSFVARGMRFYLVAFLLSRYGDVAREIIERRLGFWFTVSVAVLLVGIFSAFYMF